ncbi:MAG: ATP-binding cassette domain-containing protein [Halioglobus sp.]
MSLEIEGVRFAYDNGGFVLSVPHLKLLPGESVALVGPSGSGKTTLLNLVAGILSPEQGTISLDGQVITGLGVRQHRRHRLCRMGMIFQSFELLEYLDLRDNVLLQARLAPGVRITPQLEQQAQDIVAELGLLDKWRRPVTELSQGERQRVAVSRALLLDPPLVLADEPTGNLDPDNKRAVLDQLIALCAGGNRILLTVTHDHSLLPAFDRVVDMSELLVQEVARDG